jgi:NADH:ubiquinone oxidoreductase subunit F (NADH-binding)
VSIAARGVWGKPTLVDSAECFASLAATLSSGRPVASRIYQVSWGSKKGLVEAEPDVTIKHLLKTAGFPPGPVLGGGLAGAFLTERELDLPLNSFQRSDSPRWRTVHLLGDDADLFDIATKITAYNSRYLCGYCIPCRIGMVRMAEVMAASPVDKELLEEVAITVEKTGLCAPGRGAARLVMSVI